MPQTLYDANQVKVEGRVLGPLKVDRDPLSSQPRLSFQIENTLRRKVGSTKERSTRRNLVQIVIFGLQEGTEYIWLEETLQVAINGWTESVKSHPSYPGQEWAQVIACQWDGVRAPASAIRKRTEKSQPREVAV